MSYFRNINPYIEGNKKLREPQIEAYIKIKEYYESEPLGEALVVLPTGTGKSGLISIAPYGVAKERVLVIVPGLVTKNSVIKTLHPLEDNFWTNYDIIFDPEELPVVEEYEFDMLFSSLEKCNFVIANVHKLYKSKKTSLINKVPKDFFDMIIVDEAHHSIANTWQDVLEYFDSAKILHVTGTPYRGDHKEIPGEEIHKTSLSKAMKLKYVKWLRKVTTNNEELYFSIPGDPKKYSKEDVLVFKEKEWIQKSVALSKDCSVEVINESIKQLNELNRFSPNVPHKILAVACSIAHAEDVAKWYEEKGNRVIIVHSDQTKEEVGKNLLEIENHNCNVVVSVNMLMEGYDHRYLTVLAIFRPYKSLNAFAQVVGRVLRTIPDEEITDFAIDNNAIVVYHQETGLDVLWKIYAKEVEQSKKKTSVADYSFSEEEYIQKERKYASIEVGDGYINEKDSYLNELDFNELFEQARILVDNEVNTTVSKIRKSGDLDEDVVDELKELLKRKHLKKKSKEINDLLIEKRPELLRKTIRQALVEEQQEAAITICEEKGLDPKGTELNKKFRNQLNMIKSDTPNDGILVIYMNKRLAAKFGPVKNREPDTLLQSQKYLKSIIEELRRML